MLYIVERYSGHNRKLIIVTADAYIARKAVQTDKKIRYPESASETYIISEYWHKTREDFEKWNESGEFPDANICYAV